MWVTYRPEDGDEQRWDFQPGKVRSMEAIGIEKRYGQPFDAWRAGLMQGQVNARRVLLWHLLKKAHPTFRWEDTPDFMQDELLVESSVAEVTELRERALKATLSEEEREQLLVGLELAMSDAIAIESSLGVESEGKARSNSAMSDTP